MNGIYQNDCAEHRRSAVATTVSRMLRANTIKGADGTTITATQADPRRAWLVAKYSLSTDPKWHSIDLFMAPSHHGTAPPALDRIHWTGWADGMGGKCKTPPPPPPLRPLCLSIVVALGVGGLCDGDRPPPSTICRIASFRMATASGTESLIPGLPSIDCCCCPEL